MWEDERKECASLAEKLGFVLVPYEGTGGSYLRGDTHIWPCREGWQVADLVYGHFINHRMQKTLKLALERERDRVS